MFKSTRRKIDEDNVNAITKPQDYKVADINLAELGPPRDRIAETRCRR